jgi:hypothetical protein
MGAVRNDSALESEQQAADEPGTDGPKRQRSILLVQQADAHACKCRQKGRAQDIDMTRRVGEQVILNNAIEADRTINKERER